MEHGLNQPRTLTPGRMLLLGVGWFGAQFFWAFHAGSMPLFLRTFTDSKFEISLVLSLAGVSGFLVPPVVGYLSDRTAGPLGRRRPYILFGSLGVLVSLLALAYAPGFGMVALLSALMYLSLRAAETPYLSLLPDITPPLQRSTASGVMNLLGSVGLISFFLVSAALWERAPTTVFAIVAVVCFGGLLIAIILIREPAPLSDPPTVGLLMHFRGIASETNALKFFAAQFSWWLGFWMVSSFAILFVAEELGVPEGRAFLVLMGFSIVATLFMLPLGILGDRFGRKGILSWMIAFWAVSEMAVGFSQTLTHAVITVGLTAIPFAAVMGVGYAYFLDLIPRERTAEFVGMSVLSIAVAQILGPLIGGRLIDELGYRSIFPAAAVFMLVGLVILQFIPAPGRGEGDTLG
jgi:MFS family permease